MSAWMFTVTPRVKKTLRSDRPPVNGGEAQAGRTEGPTASGVTRARSGPLLAMSNDVLVARTFRQRGR